MRILMVASEALPFAKTGGLADVVGALPAALARQHHEVDVFMPRYRGIAAGEPVGRLQVPMGSRIVQTPVSATVERAVRTVFVENEAYYDRPFLYGTGDSDYADNAERFAFLASAAVEWAAPTIDHYDVIHVHDWQAGLVPVFLAQRSRATTPVVCTIHNLAYQGIFEASWLPRLGLSTHLFNVNALEFWGGISFLKGAIVFSRLLTTVSPRYAEEIQTPEFGFGFDGILRQRQTDLVGILNGIDYDRWDPAHDPYLPEPFGVSDLEPKRAAKRQVLQRFGLPIDDGSMARPLVGLISRLVDQKGFDLIATIADELPRLNASFVLLGTGERRYEDLWRSLASRYSDRIGAHVGFDEGLAHVVEGGADLFLMPSRFEPCGLNQMYSLRYGTVPVVRAVGGLFDTVVDFDPVTGEGTGFTFEAYTPAVLLGTLRRALDVYQDKATWRRLQVAGMQRDHSWDRSAREYVSVYARAMGR